MRKLGYLSYLALAALAVVAAACTESSNTPPAARLDETFVGYSNPTTRQTTCGNCHITKQRSWAQTHHASAWSDMEASGHASSACYACHTTNGASNTAPDSAGFFTADSLGRPYYYDVQCESCHGPGAGHVAAPDDWQPLSTIVADTAATKGCGTCHTGEHNPFVEEWQQSGHGIVESHTLSGGVVRAACAGCHEGRGALVRFKPDAHFFEQTDATTNYPITCAVCHDPHGGPNEHQLRLPINTASLETNLCMQCHQRRFAPDPTSSRGAHSPQGPMLLGEAGWVPPNFTYDATQQASTHGSSANPSLCAGCHMERFTVTASNGGFLMQVTGHRFQAIPCVDAQGVPTGAADCADTERRYTACTSSGCHATATAVRGARQILQGRLQAYVDVLWKDKNGNGVLDPLPTDSGLLAIVRQQSPCDFSTSTTAPTSGPCAGQPAGASVETVGEGVWFNADLVNRADGSWGVHNPFYAEALLLASTQTLRRYYTYLPQASQAEQRLFAERRAALGMNPQ